MTFSLVYLLGYFTQFIQDTQNDEKNKNNIGNKSSDLTSCYFVVKKIDKIRILVLWIITGGLRKSIENFHY